MQSYLVREKVGSSQRREGVVNYELSVLLGEGERIGVVFGTWSSEPALEEGRLSWVWNREAKWHKKVIRQ